jgi:hypothetical protein
MGHALLRQLRSSEVFLTPETELVIEGYPRSGNSFAEAAFHYAQGDRVVPLAHHTHAAGHVLEAVRRGLPVLLLMRNPIDAAASFMEQSEGRLSALVALREYVQFHQPLMAVEPHIVLGRFEVLIEDFPALIRRVNQRFGCDFDVFEQSPDTVREIRQKVDKISLRRAKRLTRYSTYQGVDMKEKRQATLQGYKDTLRNDAGLAVPRQKALHLYNRLCAREDTRFRVAK